MLFFVISGRLWGSILVTRGSIKHKIRVFFWLPFLGWGPGGFWDAFFMFFECFFAVFLMLFGGFLGAFGTGAAGIAG